MLQTPSTDSFNNGLTANSQKNLLQTHLNIIHDAPSSLSLRTVGEELIESPTPRGPTWTLVLYNKTVLILLLTPLFLSPLLVAGTPEWRCAYVVGIMSVYWMSEALPLAATALLPVVLFPLTQVLSAQAVAQNYINDTNFLFIGGLIVAAAVEKCDLHERVALSVLRMVGSQPKWIMLGFMCVTALLSMFISNTATTAMMVPIGQSVIAQLMRTYQDERREEEERCMEEMEGIKIRVPRRRTPAEKRMGKGLVMCICFAANIGGTGTVTGTPPNLVLLGQLTALFPGADTGLNYVTWIAFALPLMVICLFSCWLILVLFFLRGAPAADERVASVLHQRYEKLPKISYAEKSVMISFVLLLILWICRDPGFVAGFGQFIPKGYYTDATSAMIVAIMLFALPAEYPNFTPTVDFIKDHKEKRSTLMDWPTMQKKFPWSVVLLLGGGFALAAGVKESGLSVVMGNLLARFDNYPHWALEAICVVVAMLVTNICSNTVTASIFIPIANQAGLHPLSLMLPTTIACSFAFVLPVGTPPNAIVFASGTLKVSDMVICGTVISLVTGIIVVVYMNTFAMLALPLSEVPEWAFSNTTTVFP